MGELDRSATPSGVDAIEGAAPLVGALRERIRATLDPIVRGHAECALVGFPDSSNVGDSAIWLGELAWLRAAGVRIAYRCHERSYDPRILEQSTGSGLILLHGGGNLGDLWPRLQRFRERVIHDFPHRPIVQLPQTICFRDRNTLARARRVFGSHANLTILARDAASLDLARREFTATSIICPDMAFALGVLPRRRVPDVDMLWLRRTDLEALPFTDAVGARGPIVTDWLDARAPLARRVREAVQPVLHRYPRRLSTLRRFSEASFDLQARQRLQFGCALLARARVVITDRLHGHILCLLMGIPHVVLDTSYGKPRGFYETWIHPTPLARWANSPVEALAAARELLATC